jgi:hypothetical protein
MLPAAHHQGHLHAGVADRLDLFGDVVNHVRVEVVAGGFVVQGFAAEFQQHPPVFRDFAFAPTGSHTAARRAPGMCRHACI